MISADFLSTAANVTIFLTLVRLAQTHGPAKDGAFGSALGFIFH